MKIIKLRTVMRVRMLMVCGGKLFVVLNIFFGKGIEEVAQLVREYMPHLNFDETPTSLHGDVRAMYELLE